MFGLETDVNRGFRGEFGKIQRCVRKSKMLEGLLALILAVGNYLTLSFEAFRWLPTPSKHRT